MTEIRKSPLQPRAFDIVFADRYSISVIDAQHVIDNEAGIRQLCVDFYNDTYLFDQNACSSPRSIVWIGKEQTVDEAKKIFWDSMHASLEDKYTVPAIIAVDKLTMADRCAIDLDDARIVKSDDNLITRVELSGPDVDMTDYSCAGGFFLEITMDSPEPLSEVVTKKYQTLSYYGMDAGTLQRWVISAGLPGIDRIVPIGKTTEFSLIWDGHDLIDELSRICSYI